MMLTHQEVHEACNAAMRQDPDDFEKMVADFMPQTVIPKLMMEVTEARMETHGSLEMASSEAANFMMGLHVGWWLAVLATTGKHP